MQTKKCPICGEIIEKGQKYCMECGFLVPSDFFNQSDIVESQNSNSPKNKNKSTKKTEKKLTNNKGKKENKTFKIFITLTVLIVILVAIFIIISFILKKNSDNDFLKFSNVWEQAVIALQLLGVDQ